MFSCTLSDSSEPKDGHSRGGAVAENMHLHSVVYDFFRHIIVFVPKESQVVPVVFLHQETMKHLLYISQDSYLFLAEPHQDSKK